ncbi:cell wall-binding repeat-containing protein [Euzebya tangerina]|uniref:cell wall-binding repeat-containing protein n=1 Tax=Euzebya tangerina TaxID=591198 RepID=UPI0013C35204|nr:cell wall-binding repeat-containing protein [Euzebya tangerina]
MLQSLKSTGLILVLLIGLVIGLSSVATAQGDSGGEDERPDEGRTEDPGEHDDDDDDGDDDDHEEGDDGDDDRDDDDHDDDDRPGHPNVTAARVFGPDRISTSVAISRYEFPRGSREVYLAQARNFVDAVAAGSLRRGPVLLVPNCGDLPPVVAREVNRLRPHKVVALGGPDAICDAIVRQAVAAASVRPPYVDTGNDTDPGDEDDRVVEEQYVDLAVGETGTFEANIAGTVTISRTADGLVLVDAVPNDGWQIRPDDDEDDEDEVEVSFTDGTTRVDFEAEIEDGSVEIEVRVRSD